MWIKKKDFQELEARLALLERKQEQDTMDVKKDVELEYKSIYGWLKRSSIRLDKLEYQSHTEITSQLILVAHPEIQQWHLQYKQTFLGIVSHKHMYTKPNEYKLFRSDEMPDSNKDFDNNWGKYHEIFMFASDNINFIMHDGKILKQYPDRKENE